MIYHRILNNSSSCCTIGSSVYPYYIYTSLHLLFPNSQLIPPSTHSLGNHKSTKMVVFRKETPPPAEVDRKLCRIDTSNINDVCVPSSVPNALD